jgi:hypothetical protein
MARARPQRKGLAQITHESASGKVQARISAETALQRAIILEAGHISIFALSRHLALCYADSGLFGMTIENLPDSVAKAMAKVSGFKVEKDGRVTIVSWLNAPD